MALQETEFFSGGFVRDQDGRIVTIGPGVITTTELDDSSVTTIKLDDGAVTTDKLADDAVTADKFNGAPVTGVAVDAAGIHAALVTLGLITA